MNRILLHWYCTVTYTKRFSSLLCFEIYGKFRNVNEDPALVFSVVIALCSYFSVILSALLSFCSFIYKGFLCTKGQFVFSNKPFS